jgi:ornithine cyclodeaminase/alanine dehydrogenase-like protein (mu-crystallin family)
MTAAIDAMRTAFTALANGRAIMPQRVHIDMDSPEGTALFMPAAMDTALGVKTVTLFPENPGMGLPYIQGAYCLLDGTTGTLTALMDGGALTAIRTGAASGVATDLLARADVDSAAILGAGIQARSQLEAMCCVRPIVQARVFDPHRANAELFAVEMSETLGITVEVSDSAAAAICDADLVCAATVSETPVFDDADLPGGVHLNAIGSYKPHVQEIPAETVLRAKVVVDELAAALAETGDLIIPIEAGQMTAEHIHAELGEIVTGRKPGRTSDDEVTFFKSVGLAIQDLTAAETAMHNAREQGIGIEATL